MSAWAVTIGAGATMGSCMRRLPFHPEDGRGPKSITLTPAMEKHNSRVDNSPIHTSEAFQDNIPLWKDRDLDIFYLPKYSPELNCIEILWRFIKYEWIEFDAYKSWTHLVKYVENVLQNFGEKYKIIFG